MKMEAMDQRFKTFENFEQIIERVIELITAELMHKKISDQFAKLKIGLAGGKTPLPIYKKMAEVLPIDGLEFFLIDERYISLKDEKSNFFQIGKYLPKTHHFNTELSITEAVQAYDKALPEAFDLSIIGVGNDGHFASIFPGSITSNERTIHTQTDHFEVKDRLSLTPEYLLKSAKILIILQGSDKKSVYEELLYGKKTVDEFPAKNLLAHDNIEIWLAI